MRRSHILSMLLVATTCLAYVPMATIIDPSASLTVFAEELSYQGLKYEVTDGEICITGHTDELPSEVVIPAEIEGMPVTSIGMWAFYKCDDLTSFTIPDSVTDLGEYAFSLCTNLIDITLSEKMTAIYEYTFYNCKSLTSITIPDGATWIGEEAFANCTNLNYVSIPDSVRSIQNDAFSGCKNLTISCCPGGYTEEYASLHHIPFQPTTKEASGICGEDLTWALDSEGTLTISGTGDMERYTSDDPAPWYEDRFYIRSILIKDGVTDIGDNAFNDCRKLTAVTIPESVTNIGDYAFYNCRALTAVTIPESATTIGNRAFANCSTLTSAAIPDNITFIGESAFSSCTSLNSLTIGKGVSSIGDFTFSECSSLTSISIPENVTEIGEKAFMYCSGLTSVTIPGNVKQVVSSAFAYCDNLTSVTFEDGVTYIRFLAFSGCNNLTTVILPDSIISIDYNTFQNCKNVTLYGTPGGYIETYATENNILFKSIEDVSQSIKGDVNNDGEFNVADVVLLQKWLLAVPDTHLANWKAADFCNDSKLNVFDLCLMKRELLQQTTQEEITLQGTIRFDMMGSSTPVVVYTDQLSKLAQSHMYEGDSVDNVPWEKLTMNNITFGDTSIVLSQPEKDGRVSIGALSVGETTITYKIDNVTVVFDIYVYDSRQQ